MKMSTNQISNLISNIINLECGKEYIMGGLSMGEWLMQSFLYTEVSIAICPENKKITVTLLVL